MKKEAKKKAKELKDIFGKKSSMVCQMMIDETRSKFWYMVKSNL